MDSESAVKAIAGLRTVVGASAWLAPRLSGKGFGLDADANPQSPYLGRLFGARDVAMGIGTMQSTGAARDQWLKLGVGVDIADAIAAVAAGRAGYLPPVSAALVFAPAIAGVFLGIAALRGSGPSVQATVPAGI